MSGYVRLMRDIWSDADWLALDSTAKLTYLQLISQPDISRVGVLPYVPGRWASMHPDLKKDDIVRALEALVAGRFIIIDDQSEEVWVRTYIRHDELYRVPNGNKSIDLAADEVISPMIAGLIADELAALRPSRKGSDKGSDNPSDKGSDNPSDKGSDTPISLVPSPIPLVLEPETLNPEPNTLIIDMTSESTDVTLVEIIPDDDFTHFWAIYPRHTQKGNAVKRWANMPRKDRFAALEALPIHIERWRMTNTEEQFIPHPATWLYQRRWEDEIRLTSHMPKLSKSQQVLKRAMERALAEEAQQ